MAQVNGKDPQSMKVAELKYWLTQKSLSTKGKKADLVKRYSKSNVRKKGNVFVLLESRNTWKQDQIMLTII